eukprot:2850210-Rhodomonas_salina.1
MSLGPGVCKVGTCEKGYNVSSDYTILYHSNSAKDTLYGHWYQDFILQEQHSPSSSTKPAARIQKDPLSLVEPVDRLLSRTSRHLCGQEHRKRGVREWKRDWPPLRVTLGSLCCYGAARGWYGRTGTQEPGYVGAILLGRGVLPA